MKTPGGGIPKRGIDGQMAKSQRVQHEAIGGRKDTLVGRDKRRMNFPYDDILVSTPSGRSVDGFEKRIWGKEATPSTRISIKHSELKKKR